jgi:hypothetical protein
MNFTCFAPYLFAVLHVIDWYVEAYVHRHVPQMSRIKSIYCEDEECSSETSVSPHEAARRHNPWAMFSLSSEHAVRALLLVYYIVNLN